jgi:hypothetical protein
MLVNGGQLFDVGVPPKFDVIDDGGDCFGLVTAGSAGTDFLI